MFDNATIRRALPGQLFTSTQIPVSLRLLVKNKNAAAKRGSRDRRQQRESRAKFSHVAERSEVEENDYNLNIPRYVDTFDEEEKVDLAAVSAQLTALEVGMSATNKEIAGFCKELGIAPPF